MAERAGLPTHLRGGHEVGRAAAHGDRDRAAGRAADAGGQLVVHALQQAARRAVQEPRVRVLVAGPAQISCSSKYDWLSC